MDNFASFFSSSSSSSPSCPSPDQFERFMYADLKTLLEVPFMRNPWAELPDLGFMPLENGDEADNCQTQTDMPLFPMPAIVGYTSGQKQATDPSGDLGMALTLQNVPSVSTVVQDKSPQATVSATSPSINKNMPTHPVEELGVQNNEIPTVERLDECDPCNTLKDDSSCRVEIENGTVQDVREIPQRIGSPISVQLHDLKHSKENSNSRLNHETIYENNLDCENNSGTVKNNKHNVYKLEGSLSKGTLRQILSPIVVDLDSMGLDSNCRASRRKRKRRHAEGISLWGDPQYQETQNEHLKDTWDSVRKIHAAIHEAFEAFFWNKEGPPEEELMLAVCNLQINMLWQIFNFKNGNSDELHMLKLGWEHVDSIRKNCECAFTENMEEKATQFGQQLDLLAAQAELCKCVAEFPDCIDQKRSHRRRKRNRSKR